MLRTATLLSFVAFAFTAIVSSVSLVQAAPLTIVELHLGGVSQPEIEFTNGVLSTINDGDAGTPGEQNTDVVFDSLLNSVADIFSGASFTFDGVTAIGAPGTGPGGIFQAMSGGTFSLWGNDVNQSLLLSGTFGTGTIVGADSTSIGSFFTTEVGALTGGSLVSLLPANIPL